MVKIITIKISKKDNNFYNLTAGDKKGKSSYYNINKKELNEFLDEEVEKL